MDDSDNRRLEWALLDRDERVALHDRQVTTWGASQPGESPFESENCTNLPTGTSQMPDLPSSIRVAIENSGLALEQVESVDIAASSTAGSARRESISPRSFHHRSLRVALPQIQYDFDDLYGLSNIALPVASTTDSAVGGFSDWVGMADLSEYSDVSLDENSSLQYHLIGTEGDGIISGSNRPAADIVKSLPESNRSSKVPLSTVTLKANDQPSSTDLQLLTCHLCNRSYKGNWAHRNLTRHQELTHTPSESPDAVRQFLCGKLDCGRTFRRNDARLVHERRSHPELNRPPPNKRKRP